MSTEKKADDGTVEIHLTVAQKQELLQLTTKQQELMVNIASLSLQRRALAVKVEETAAALGEVQRAFSEKMKAVISMGGGSVDSGSVNYDFNTGVIKAKKAAAPPDEKTALN